LINWLHELPVVVGAALIILFFLVPTIIGVSLLQPIIVRLLRREKDPSLPVGYLLNAFTLYYAVLLALLSVAVFENYNKANDAVGREATAIVAFYRDLRGYPEPARSELIGLLQRYLDEEKLLFAVPWGPQGIYAKKELDSIDDMKGLKWRAYNVGTARIAELVGAQPVTIQAAELPQALATGVVNAFMTSGSTGYDSKAWETMTHFYDAQAWIPKNVTFVNAVAFNALDKAIQDAILTAAKTAETRGWKMAEEKNAWYLEQLKAKGMKVTPPSEQLKDGLQKVGDQLTADWIKKAGPDGQAIIEQYKKM